MEADEGGSPLRRHPFARVLLLAACAIAAAAAAVAIAWGAASLGTRTPDYVEGCVLFNASRYRDGLALYVDPIAGAHEYGEPPSHYMVAYTPIYALVLAALPAASALVVGRAIGLALWLGILGAIIRASAPACRKQTWLAGGFVAGVQTFIYWVTSARPDPLALALSVGAFIATLRRGRTDAWTAALFVIAAYIKPSVVGLGASALCADMVLRRTRAWPSIVSATSVAIGMAGVLAWASRGAAFDHLLPALALRFEGARLVENLAHRLPFFGLLLACAFAAAWRSRGEVSARIAMAALASSTLATLGGLGKVGAASNYWLEPCLAAVAILARFPMALPRSDAGSIFGAAFFVVQAAWSGTATFRNTYDWLMLPNGGSALARFRAACGGGTGSFVVADNPGTEFALNGRIYTHALEFSEEIRRGRYPVGVWVADMQRPEISCVVTSVPEGTRAPDAPAVPFPPPVASALAERFRLAETLNGYALYRSRRGAW